MLKKIWKKILEIKLRNDLNYRNKQVDWCTLFTFHMHKVESKYMYMFIKLIYKLKILSIHMY